MLDTSQIDSYIYGIILAIGVASRKESTTIEPPYPQSSEDKEQFVVPGGGIERGIFCFSVAAEDWVTTVGYDICIGLSRWECTWNKSMDGGVGVGVGVDTEDHIDVGLFIVERANRISRIPCVAEVLVENT